MSSNRHSTEPPMLDWVVVKALILGFTIALLFAGICVGGFGLVVLFERMGSG